MGAQGSAVPLCQTRWRRNDGNYYLEPNTGPRPVPFWRQALAVVIETSPRVSVEAVPWRRALASARAVSWTSD